MCEAPHRVAVEGSSRDDYVTLFRPRVGKIYIVLCLCGAMAIEIVIAVFQGGWSQFFTETALTFLALGLVALLLHRKAILEIGLRGEALTLRTGKRWLTVGTEDSVKVNTIFSALFVGFALVSVQPQAGSARRFILWWNPDFPEQRSAVDAAFQEFERRGTVHRIAWFPFRFIADIKEKRARPEKQKNGEE
jgi:hypothetical protein